MRTNFRSYNLALSFYRQVQSLPLAGDLKDQLNRAASGIVLTLAEGSGRATRPDRRRFYVMAFGSIRECQAVLDLTDAPQLLVELADSLAASVYKLVESQRP